MESLYETILIFIKSDRNPGEVLKKRGDVLAHGIQGQVKQAMGQGREEKSQNESGRCWVDCSIDIHWVLTQVF